MRIPLLTDAAKSARARRPLTLLAALAVLAVAGGVTLATAAPAVPTPTISSGPASPTNQTSASFAFKGAAGVTFLCSLDGAAFAACTSPKAYAGPLAAGPHTFRVEARNSKGQLSAPASRSWTIDATPPPVPQFTYALTGAISDTHAGFGFADAESGVTYLCRLDAGAWASCWSGKSYGGLSQGPHAFSVEARDAAGNLSAAATTGWTVDTIAPPKPLLTQHPNDPSNVNVATFAFTDAEAGAGYECRLDNEAWAACTSPVSRGSIANGTHHFRVRALDAAGNRSDAVDFAWKVAQQSGLPFSVSGSLTGLLAPGLSGSLLLKVSNPNGVPIVVTSITVTVQPGSTKAGCDGPANLQVAPSSASAANPLTIPANGSVTLPSGGVSAPQVLMRNLPVNQDACKGATFSFAYGGSAHS